jgi:two-component system response regulator QseB
VKILLIEDDLDLGNGVRIALSDQGFDVIWVRRKEDALHQLDVCVPELILLDLGLPDGDGMSLMTRLRQQLKGIPVIILTARGTLQDRLCGLDAGADDYLVKPFILAELLARVRALARRSYGFENEAIEIRGLSLHVPTRRVTVSARHIDLTASEYALLETLMLRADRVLTAVSGRKDIRQQREPQQRARRAYGKFAAENRRRLCANGPGRRVRH